MALTYNVRWIEHTFTSPAVTESLLAQERESANITNSDYEAAIRFFPGPNRRYRLAGGIAAIPITFALRKPGWSNIRTYLFMTASSLAGVVIGHTMSIKAHLSFVRSIENPAGFSQALNNIQKNTGGSSFPGPVIVRRSEKSTVDFDTEFPAASPPESQRTPTNTTTTDSAAPSTPTSSIWEQIRAANSRTSRSSTWDAIRQTQERKRVGEDHNPGADQYEDRATEQAKFDALLEKERNIK